MNFSDTTKLYRCSPKFRGFINSSNAKPLMTLIAPSLGCRVDVSEAVAKLIVFACHVRTKAEIIEHLNKQLPAQDKHSLVGAIVDSLISYRILIESDACEAATMWETYNWREAFFFHSSSSNTTFVEDEQGPGKELIPTTLSGYLADRPLDATFFFKQLPGKSIPLPPPLPVPEGTLEQAMRWRRTIRDLTNQPIDWETCSSLLHYGSLKSRKTRREAEEGYRQNPNLLMASLFSPFEVYLVARRVSDLESGLYFYDQRENALTLVQPGDHEDKIHRAVIGQRMGQRFAFSIVITAIFERYQWRYRNERGYRNLLITLGEFGQMFIVAASAFRVKHWMTPALRDRELNSFLQVNEAQEQAMYVLGFGG